MGYRFGHYYAPLGQARESIEFDIWYHPGAFFSETRFTMPSAALAPVSAASAAAAPVGALEMGWRDIFVEEAQALSPLDVAARNFDARLSALEARFEQADLLPVDLASLFPVEDEFDIDVSMFQAADDPDGQVGVDELHALPSDPAGSLASKAESDLAAIDADAVFGNTDVDPLMDIGQGSAREPLVEHFDWFR